MKALELPIYEKRNLAINENYYQDIKNELEEFLLDEDWLKRKEFVQRILFNQEIKANNSIEGINDDLRLIEDVINNNTNISDEKRRKEIINLYNGYRYILTNKDIDKEHLKELYRILSDGLLCKEDIDRMGEYYREDIVYILKKGRLDMELSQGLEYSLIDKYMNIYFDYINKNSDGTITDTFVKSQIMHFYFVYIHPYFDVNGRTSRTMAMWYLLNKEAYPYIIFNRAINNNASNYDEAIMDTKNNADISFFIKYMMINVKKELEKEIIMKDIRDNTTYKMNAIDYQAINYILSMKGDINVLTFSSLYRRDNDYMKVREIYLQVLRPLIDKGILQVLRLTNKDMFYGYRNEVLRINPNRFDRDNPKIRRLDLSNK